MSLKPTARDEQLIVCTLAHEPHNRLCVIEANNLFVKLLITSGPFSIFLLLRKVIWIVLENSHAASCKEK